MLISAEFQFSCWLAIGSFLRIDGRKMAGEQSQWFQAQTISGISPNGCSTNETN